MKPNTRRGRAQTTDATRADGVPDDAAVKLKTATVSGAVAGAAMGAAAAGPIGAIAGGFVGTVIGAVTGEVLEEDAERRHSHDHVLDDEIGVTSGDLGAASPDQPPARIGAFSSGSAGAPSSTPRPSEGPMQDLEPES